MIVLPQRGPC